MLLEYKTIRKRAQAELVEKKSRFLANVAPAESEEEARQFLEEIRKKYYDARHHVFAYQIGERDEYRRQSDDGEPAGTGGKPVLDVLLGAEVKNTIIVVTRYFGGTLLGTGGLVRAYGGCAKLGLLEAGVCDVAVYCEISVTVEYHLSGKIQYEILGKGYHLQDTLYTDKVAFLVCVKKAEAEPFCKQMTEAANGKAEFAFLGERTAFLEDGVLLDYSAAAGMVL